MDKRWSLSQFAGLPRQFISFANRLDLQYRSKKKLLVDRDGEPVAWLMDVPETRAARMAGIDPLEVVLWHPDGEAKVSYKQLSLIETRADLLVFQGRSLEHSGELSSFSISDVMEDAKERAIRLATGSKMFGIGVEIGSTSPPNLPEALKELGTVGSDDMLKDVQGQKVFVDVFENIGLIKPEEITPRASRPSGGREN